MSTPREDGFSMPAEWAPHQGCLMEWPTRTRAELWGALLEDAKRDYAAVARAIAAFEPVIMVADPPQAGEARDHCGAGIEILPVPIDDSWMRDNGPIFVADPQGRLALVHFRFNSWGERYLPYDRDALVPAAIAAHLGIRRYAAPFVLEGGSFFVDGEGTLLTTEQCLLNPNRNPALSRADIERGIRDFLGAEVVVWLGMGHSADRDTDGHVDGVAQYIRPGTVMIHAPGELHHPADPGGDPPVRREDYAPRFGPTTGDLVRLADTGLWVRVGRDDAGYGDEPVWGYAKNFRSRQAQFDRATPDSELDMLIAGVVVIDPFLGVVKTNIGIKEGRIAGIGRAGNPDITAGVDLTIGPNTWPVDGYGLIATAGGIDSHVHLMSPRLVPAALSAGITTLITAGFEEPPYVMDKTLRAFEYLPVNLGLQASARTDVPGQAESVLEAGACGLKIHEDWGAYPEIIDATLRLADAHDVAVCLHTDGLNESCELEDTIEAIGGRAVHAYHVEGAGGGHVPDLIGIVGEPNVVCSSTTPTIPYGPATAAEHLEMILLVHGGSAGIQEDVDAARERIHPATMAAEGPLHELGAISIVNSDSQGMGRIGETIRRTWQLAHAMKLWRQTPLGHGWPGAPAAGRAGDQRVLQYLAKYTAEPARVHGIEEEAGSLRPGRLADIVLWRPAHFGVRPELVLKGGWFSWGPIGAASPALSTTFVSASADHAGIRRRLGSSRRFTAVRGTRRISRADLVANTAVTPVEVDLPAGTVRLRGRVLRAEPVPEVPLSRRYLLG